MGKVGGDLEGKLGYREVMLKLSWAMLCYVMLKLYVRFCSAMLLVLHPEMLSPQQDQEGFCELCWLHFGVKEGYLMATLVPSWGQLRRFWGSIWDHFGPCCFGIVKSNPKISSETLPSLALKAKQNQIKNRPKTQKLRQNANLHGNKGKT